MLYKVEYAEFLGFYSEYGGTVAMTGSKNGKPVYSFAGASDEYIILEHRRPDLKVSTGRLRLDEFKLREIGTGELRRVDTEFVGVAKSAGGNEFIV